jgi:hypothetical protein
MVGISYYGDEDLRKVSSFLTYGVGREIINAWSGIYAFAGPEHSH